jgi:hypothetical protein
MNIKKIFVFVLAILMAVTTFITPAYADSEQYLILGENLSDSEKATVLELLGVDNIEHYNVAYITNAEEFDTLSNLTGKGEWETFAAENVGGTPLTLIIKNNKVIGGISGYTETENVVSAFKDAGLKKK